MGHSKINNKRSHIKMLKLFILTLCVLSTLAHNADVAKHEDLIQRYIDNVFETYEVKGEDDPVPIMIAHAGYPPEVHQVTTEDGYRLEMHRIPFGKRSPLEPGVTRPVVYLQHGLLCSSADWVMGYDTKSLGYILADAGYDVWLGNYRGNTYSRYHETLDPNKNEFWKFSWNEMGTYDIPAMIDTILAETGAEKIHYIGHSMGTTGLMVMADKRTEYLDKLIMVNLLAPVAYVEHMKSPISIIAPFVYGVEWITDALGIGEFLPSNWFMDLLADLFCNEGIFQGVCSNILFLLCGFDEAQLNETLLETIMHHTPAGASSHTILHYGQECYTGGFMNYDHQGDNVEYYGQPNTPPYDLSKVTVPTSIYWGQNDWFTVAEDLLELVTRLPNLYDNYEVPYYNWNHLDFLWGIDAPTLVWNRVQENMAGAQEEFGSKQLKLN